MPTLHQPSSPAWLDAALRALPLILLDHAHCEKKAASTAVGFLFKYPERAPMVSAMSRVAREELVHFERLLGLLRAREIEVRRIQPSRYGEALHKLCRSWQPARFVDHGQAVHTEPGHGGRSLGDARVGRQ